MAACAACKYQRRRCTPECPLAHYFPHDQPGVFRSAHRLFGVSNILKTLARAGPARSREAMHCIVYESQAWDAYPAAGCVPIILDLQHRIRQARLDLHRVKACIRAYQQQGQQHPAAGGGGADDPPRAAALFIPSDQQQHQHQHQHLMTTTMNTAAAAAASDDGDSIATAASVTTPPQPPPWIMQPPQYHDMVTSNDVAADMAAAGIVPRSPSLLGRRHDDTSVPHPHPYPAGVVRGDVLLPRQHRRPG